MSFSSCDFYEDLWEIIGDISSVEDSVPEEFKTNSSFLE